MSGPDSSSADAVVGCIAGLSFEQIGPFLGSLDACGFAGRRLLIHIDTDPATLAELSRRGCELFDASELHSGGDGKLHENPVPDEISGSRFFYIWHFLRGAAAARPIRYLIAADARDVVFQRNPSTWLEENLGDKQLVAGCESLRFEDEPWNGAAMRDSFGPRVWEACRRNLVYNAGTIAGTFQTMVDLALQVYLIAPGDRVHYSDQAALNLLLGSAVYRDITQFVPSEGAWACQAGTTAEPNLLEQVRPHLTSPLPVFDGEFVRTAGGDVFVMVHQYDRVPEWDARLRAKYHPAHAVTP